jgi:hypothetical protein
MDNSTDTHGIGEALAAMALAPFILAAIIWIVMAVVAAAVAPADRRLTFALVTFFLLGPLGLACALVANPRD